MHRRAVSPFQLGGTIERRNVICYIIFMEIAFSLSIEGIRAIEQAHIELNGITVLTGDNGCGKTTISKLLYGFIKTSINFRQVVTDFYARKIESALDFVEEFLPPDIPIATEHSPLFIESKHTPYPINFSGMYMQRESIEKYIEEELIPHIQRLKQFYQKKQQFSNSRKIERIKKLLEKRLQLPLDDKADILTLLEAYERYVTNLVEEINKTKESRSIDIFNKKFSEYFEEQVAGWNYSFCEYSANLIDRETGFVLEQRSFSDAIYIDSPTIFDNIPPQNRRNILSSDLYEKLVNSTPDSIHHALIDVAISDILNGEIVKKNDFFSKIFIYKAKDGREIPLSQAASGIKCFAMLERLYKAGALTSDTLLIIDEPEVHLHPKWIVEYARVIVLIQKYLGTTILLASHSPDMISALRYIAAKEKTQDTLVFYHAERVDSTSFGKYQFKSLGLDIEEIFSSFNIALDRINQYGEFEDE